MFELSYQLRVAKLFGVPTRDNFEGGALPGKRWKAHECSGIPDVDVPGCSRVYPVHRFTRGCLGIPGHALRYPVSSADPKV